MLHPNSHTNEAEQGFCRAKMLLADLLQLPAISILQRLGGGLTLEQVVTDLVENHSDMLPANRRVTEGTLSKNNSGYNKARQSLPIKVVEEFTHRICDHLVCDHLARRAQSFFLNRLPENSIVLADSGFGVFSVAFHCQGQGKEFLLRLTKQRYKSHLRKATLVEEGPGYRTHHLIWNPSSKERKNHPHLPGDALCEVFVHQVDLDNGQTLELVTNIEVDALSAGELYSRDCRHEATSNHLLGLLLVRPNAKPGNRAVPRYSGRTNTGSG